MGQNSLSSGPKTEAGKAVSSQNARKDAIFVQGYLPHEDVAVKQEQFSQLRAQWQAIILVGFSCCAQSSRRNWV
jgi:hypothetical protein